METPRNPFSKTKKSPHHPTLSFSFFNGPAGPKFMFRRRKTKKKREKKEGDHKMSSNGMSSNVVLQPNPPHLTDP
jgi:cytochrome P450